MFRAAGREVRCREGYSAQSESLRLAQADYEASLNLAQPFGYPTLYPTIEHFLRELTVRRRDGREECHRLGDARTEQRLRAEKVQRRVVNGQCVPDRVDLPAGFIALVQKDHLLDERDARGLVTRRQFHAAAGEADQALTGI